MSDPISYEQWGREFFRVAVTSERILGAVDDLAGQPIDFGPIGVGPGKVARVRAKGAIGQATVQPLPGDLISHRVLLPVDLTFDLDLQVEKQRFRAQLEVPLVLTARAMPDLGIAIEIAPPEPDDVSCVVKADGLRASIVQRIANVEGELKGFVARYVAREIAKPHITRATSIDVRASIEKSWSAQG